MDARLITLKLFLDELQTPTDIETVDDRKRVQKAVYLGQLSGVDLSYRFGWYLMGPYSPSLTKDYYALSEAIASGDEDYKAKHLQEGVKDRIRKVSPLLSKPEDAPLTPEQWLELVASFHYLRSVSKQSDAEAARTLKKEKPLLAPFVDQARKALVDYGFLD